MLSFTDLAETSTAQPAIYERKSYIIFASFAGISVS